MRNKLIAALVILALPTAAYATPRPRASDTPGVGTDTWDTCTVSEMALMRAPHVWGVSWHDCLL
jgi:hypothetical protein